MDPMKKYVGYIVFAIFVGICLVLSLFFVLYNKPIKISDEMLTEENYMESAWDFSQNLNIGWNLGMSLSANIRYREIITYNVIVNNNKSEEFKSLISNSFIIDNKIDNDLNIEFNIPYCCLDGVLYWTLDELILDGNIIVKNKFFMTNVNGGKTIAEIKNIYKIEFRKIEIKLTINKLYEYNTKEKVDFYETFWCSTKTTKKLIQTLKNKGFNAIRISFDVYNHLDNEGVIDSLWIDRLQEIVDYCIDENVYCLIDIVETYGICVDDMNNEDLDLFSSLWLQVATRFKDYDHKLLFSPFNEIRYTNGSWEKPSDDLLNNMNYLYQKFVDIIRSTGSNNRYRNLILTTYAAGFSDNISAQFVIPNDLTYNHLLVECHVYHPVNFTFNELNLGSTDFVYEWGSRKDKNSLNDIFKSISQFMKKTKLPVIIGEFGVVDRNSTSEMIEYYQYYKKKTKKYKIGILIFDDSYDFKIIDRNTYEFINEEIIDVLVS